eukprot:357806-Chlamydomonas_euryale.AAC.5
MSAETALPRSLQTLSKRKGLFGAPNPRAASVRGSPGGSVKAPHARAYCREAGSDQLSKPGRFLGQHWMPTTDRRPASAREWCPRSGPLCGPGR